MVDNNVAPSSSSPAMSVFSSYPSSTAAASRPMLTLPPRSSMDTLFTGGVGASPGPMTLVSRYFSDNDPDPEHRTFSQFLTASMESPKNATAVSPRPPLAPASSAGNSSREMKSGSDSDDFRFKENRPSGLKVSQLPVFTVPPGLSPACLLDSPAFASGSQGPFGMSHQQVLAQVTAQAAPMQILAEHSSSSLGAPAASVSVPSFTSSSTMPSLTNDLVTMLKEPSESFQSHQQPPLASFNADKPAEDGYNWRKYGQKHVKGSAYPRGYYKCTHPSCPVKKQVEHSAEGHVSGIVYRGQHNHSPPQPNKRFKDVLNLNFVANSESFLKEEVSDALANNMDHESSQATPEHLPSLSGSEDVGDNETAFQELDEDEPDSKRRNTENRVSEPASSHRTITESRIIVQTLSEVDLLDDGYKWRKYGQKVVKGNPYPRSYYKCTYPGCSIRKHIERAPTDPKAVVTTYEGKHNHDVPVAKTKVRHSANPNAPHPKPECNASNTRNDWQQTITGLQLKEEQT